MNGGTSSIPGIDSGRKWTALPDNDHPLEWCMNPEGEFLQGPLEMAILRGKKILLNLESGQVALLVAEERLRAIFLEGGHVLDVGTRPGQVNPLSSLIFLAVDQPLDLRWTHGSPIDLPGPTRRHVIGNCSLQISAPARFFEHFLRQAESQDVQTLLDAMERTTRNSLTDFLTAASGEGSGDSAGLQTTLMSLQAETLSDDLADCGLTCTHLALYTAHPPVESWNGDPDRQETAGHSPQLAHN
jgi:hypothetical protein